MGRVVAVVAVAQPPLDGVGVDQVVAGGVPEEVLEVEAVGLAVAGEVGGKPLAEQLAALFKDQFELLDSCCPVDLVENILTVVESTDLLYRPFERGDAAAQERGVDAHGRSCAK